MLETLKSFGKRENTDSKKVGADTKLEMLLKTNRTLRENIVNSYIQ